MKLCDVLPDSKLLKSTQTCVTQFEDATHAEASLRRGWKGTALEGYR
jgi:hypothetical protein